METIFTIAIYIFIGYWHSTNCETTLPNPAFVNIAPCPCDLTENLYDNNCCCDADLQDSPATDFLSVSSCTPGVFGGNFTVVNEHMCRQDQSYTPDWFPFTCIQFLNTPSLGLYYYPAQTINTGSFPQSTFSYNRNQDIPIQCTGSECSYGEEIKTSNPDSILTLPQNIANGHCVDSPVHYLMDTTASCDRTVDAFSCTAGTYLDASYYTSNNGAKASVTCITRNSTEFVKTNTGTESSTDNSLFNSTTTNGETAVNCLLAEATFGGNTCSNAVADVKYDFTWNNTNLILLAISITLVNVSETTFESPGPNFVLTQTFTSTFTHASASSVDSTAISGNIGHEFGLPVISGLVDVNGTVDFTTENQLKIWRPASSGLCANADTTAPPFGYDVISGCTLVFDYQDCDQLRATVELQQEQLVKNDIRVSRFGNPDPTLADEDWIPIIRDLSNFTSEANATAGQCQGIPSRTTIEFFWAITGGQNGEDTREIVGARVSWQRENWDLSCLSASADCDLNTFQIYSTVTFTKKPAQEPTPLTTYELNSNKSCRRDATCWPELLLPIQPDFFYLYDIDTADVLRTYNYRWAVTVTFFSVAAAVIPAHWASIGRYIKQVLPL